MESLRRKVIALATSIASQESEVSGKDYYDCINEACEETYIRLKVNSKEVINMFLWEE